MELNSVSVTIDGMDFQIHPMVAFKALRMERIISKLIAPIFLSLTDSAVEVNDIKELMKKKVDLSKLGSSIVQALNSLSDKEYELLVFDLLAQAYIFDANALPIQINKEIFDATFTGKLTTMYKLLFEIMKASKFSFFELVAGGL